MSLDGKKGSRNSSNDIDQHYMDIINAIPDIVYWVDMDCNLLGCNINFVNLLGLKGLHDFKGTPYQQMQKSKLWPHSRIESFKLDDMKVIFSGIALSNVEESPVFMSHGQTLYFKSNRVPMYDENKKIIGLIVVLTDISALKQLEQQAAAVLNASAKKENIFSTKQSPLVLMIEDNVIAQSVEKAILTGLNCRVDIAESGDEALRLFNPGKYDLVLMDIGLEDTSGYVVAKRLRQLEKESGFNVPIIALTGYQADVVKYDCEQYFMQGVITKPLTSEQADQIIKHYIYHMDVVVTGLKRV